MTTNTRVLSTADDEFMTLGIFRIISLALSVSSFWARPDPYPGRRPPTRAPQGIEPRRFHEKHQPSITEQHAKFVQRGPRNSHTEQVPEDATVTEFRSRIAADRSDSESLIQPEPEDRA